MSIDMEYIHSIDNLRIPEKTVATIGKFDGIHRGHQDLINKVKEYGSETIRTVIFTFDISPKELLAGRNEKVLVTNHERALILEKMGIDYLIECPFTSAISQMEAEDFIRDFLIGRLNMKYVVVGEDNHFGKDRKGDSHLLQRMGEELGFETFVLLKKQLDDKDISSSSIKREMKRGNMGKVNELLGYPYTIVGKVVYGNQLGRTINVPTTNLIPETAKILPPNGVYTSKSIVDGTYYNGITNIGYNPTIGDHNLQGVETYMFDYDGNLYGKEIAIQLFAFERTERKFTSVEELQKQLAIDIAFGKEFFK